MPRNPDTVITLENVRISYANIFEPRESQDGGPAKYDCTILIPKNDEANRAKIKAATEAAKADALAGVWTGKAPAEYKNPPVRDGDKRDTDELGAFKNALYINAKSKDQPGIYRYIGKKADGKPDFEPIDDPTVVYSGCYCHVNVTCFPYNHEKGGKGLAWALNLLVKTQDGEAFAQKADVGRAMEGIDFDGVLADAMDDLI